MNTKNRGFASMAPDKQKAIASLGGKKVSANSAYMAEIGRRGGINSAAKRKGGTNAA